MKLSNKILTWGFSSIIIIFLIFVFYMTINSTDNEEFRFKNNVNVGNKLDLDINRENYKKFDLFDNEELDFTDITLVGAWDAEVVYGSKREVVITTTDELLEQIRFEDKNRNLVLVSPDIDNLSTMDENSEYKVKIITPDVNLINIKGAGNFIYKGFESESLDMVISGALNIEGHDFKLEKLNIDLSGAGNLDFRNGYTEELNIESTMLGNIEISVKNADISGYIKGMGAITIYGNVKNNNLEIDGLVDFQIK